MGSERAMLECSGCIKILRWVLGSVVLTISWWSESLVELNMALGLLPRPVESYIPRAGFRNLYLLSATDTCGTEPRKSPWIGTKRMSSWCLVSLSVVSNSIDPMNCSPPWLLCTWDSAGKNTGVGGHFFLQGIFLSQRSTLGLLHCWQSLPSEPPT